MKRGLLGKKIVMNDNLQYMFEEERTSVEEVIIRVTHKSNESFNPLRVCIAENGEISMHEIVVRVKDMLENHADSSLFFYLDHLQESQILIKEDEQHFVHFSSVINENIISLRVETQISDELMANPESKAPRSKRNPERFIFEAFEIVEQWRKIYREGTKKGNKEKINLDKAAELLDTPRKTLEDFYLLIRNGVVHDFDFSAKSREKIGVLRAFVKEKRKESSVNPAAISMKDESNFFLSLRRRIFGLSEKEKEEDLFKVMEVEEENGGSDEDVAQDLIFEH